MSEQGLLARHVPPAISGAVGQDGQIVARAVGLKPVGRDIGQFFCGKGSDLVENIALREFTSVEKSGDAFRDLDSQSDRKQRERHRLVHHMFEWGVVVVVALSAKNLIEIVCGEYFIETARLCAVNKYLSRLVNDGLHRSDRRRAAACL